MSSFLFSGTGNVIFGTLKIGKNNQEIANLGFLNTLSSFSFLFTYLREEAQKVRFFWGEFSQMWVGGGADSQTRSKPIKKPDPNITFCFHKSHKNPGVDGWVNRFGRDLPKKSFLFVGDSPNDKEWLWWMMAPPAQPAPPQPPHCWACAETWQWRHCGHFDLCAQSILFQTTWAVIASSPALMLPMVGGPGHIALITSCH